MATQLLNDKNTAVIVIHETTYKLSDVYM